MYSDEDLESFRKREGLERTALSQPWGAQIATLELTGGRTAVVSVRWKALLDREEYCFKLTVEEEG
jgi:hypothetical protein